MADNYSDVLMQLKAGGLRVESLTLGRLTRCDAEGHKKKAGWYNLKEIQLRNGSYVIVGYAGINKGDDHGTFEIELDKDKKFDAEDHKLIRLRQEEAKKAEESRRKMEVEDAALLAELVFFNSLPLSQ